jgi:hypothetical protein
MDVIYNNTSVCTYFQAMSIGETWYDAGNVPSPTHPPFAFWTAGCATQYAITGIEIGYCTDQPTVDLELRFIDEFWLNTQTENGNISTVNLTGLPGATQPGVFTCWTLTVDLRGSGQEFVLAADGDGVYDEASTSNDELFGYSPRVTNLAGTQTGALFAGDPNDYMRGARWSRPVIDYGSPGVGRWNSSDIAVVSPGWSGWFDIHFCQGFYLRLFADACGTPAGSPFCTGDGSGVACPCANISPSLNREGCRNSVNGVNGGRLEATGTASLAADTALLTALRLPSWVSTLFFQGSTRVGGGLGATFGDGLRCAGGTTQRLGTLQTDWGGQVTLPPTGGTPISVLGTIPSPGTRTYQAWYRNSESFCTPSGFNLTNGWEIVWGL